MANWPIATKPTPPRHHRRKRARVARKDPPRKTSSARGEGRLDATSAQAFVWLGGAAVASTASARIVACSRSGTSLFSR
jgi:hypothetical protein